jgi:LacI family transcriptional regulator
VGFVTVDDQRAVAITELARRAAVEVPRQLAVVSIENDGLVCEMGWPPISSLDLAGERVGFEIGKLLEHLLEGGKPPLRPLLIHPGQVAQRGSTMLAENEDALIFLAVSFIKAHFSRKISIGQIAEKTTASRRVLDRRFRAILGKSVGEYVQHIRVESLARLLRESDGTVKEAARMSGFHSLSQMREAFQKHMGCSPRDYQRQTGTKPVRGKFSRKGRPGPLGQG